MVTSQLTRDEVRILRDLPFFVGIGETELLEIVSSARRRTYRRGEIIHHVDDVAGDFFVITTGHVKHRLMASDGRQITHALNTAGDFFGMLSVLDHKRRAGDAVAMTDCEVLVVDRESILQFRDRHPQADAVLLDIHVTGLRHLLEIIHDLAFLSVPMRLAKSLLQNSETDATGGLSMPVYLNQTEIACLVGTTRESINQGLKHFQRQGWITLEGRRIRIADAAALRRAAGLA